MQFANDELEKRARTTVILLVKSIKEAEILESIVSAYFKFCESDSAAKIGIKPIELKDENIKRLLFEILAFGSFLVIIQSPKYAQNFQHFNEQLLIELHKFFVRQHINVLPEIILKAITPEIEFGYGKPFNEVERIDKYIDEFSAKQGGELRAFGKNVAKAIDPKHYPLLEIIGGEFGSNLPEVTHLVMESVFTN